MSRIALNFANASCAHCARLVTRTLNREKGIRRVEVDPAGQRVLVDFDPQYVSPDAILAVMERSGYPARLVVPGAGAWRPAPSLRGA